MQNPPGRFQAIGTVERSHEILTPIGEKAASRSPVLETHTRTVAYENGDDYLNANASEVPGELISSKAVTTGNRTVETLTVSESPVCDLLNMSLSVQGREGWRDRDSRGAPRDDPWR